MSAQEPITSQDVKCPKCGSVLMYQDDDADGPCDQYVCMGDDHSVACLDYYTRDEYNDLASAQIGGAS